MTLKSSSTSTPDELFTIKDLPPKKAKSHKGIWYKGAYRSRDEVQEIRRKIRKTWAEKRREKEAEKWAKRNQLLLEEGL